MKGVARQILEIYKWSYLEINVPDWWLGGHGWWNHITVLLLRYDQQQHNVNSRSLAPKEWKLSVLQVVLGVSLLVGLFVSEDSILGSLIRCLDVQFQACLSVWASTTYVPIWHVWSCPICRSPCLNLSSLDSSLSLFFLVESPPCQCVGFSCQAEECRMSDLSSKRGYICLYCQIELMLSLSLAILYNYLTHYHGSPPSDVLPSRLSCQPSRERPFGAQ